MLHLNFSDIFRQSETKVWEKLLFERFGVSIPFSLLTMLKNNKQN